MITKSDLVKAVSKKCALPFSTTERVTDVLFMEIAEAILKGEDVALARLGRFHVMERKSRRGKKSPDWGRNYHPGSPRRERLIFLLPRPWRPRRKPPPSSRGEVQRRMWNTSRRLPVGVVDRRFLSPLSPLQRNKEMSIAANIMELLEKMDEVDSVTEKGRGRMTDYTFTPFEQVLVRDNDDDFWKADFFSHFNDDSSCYQCAISYWEQCIPFKGNEKLLGTTDTPVWTWTPCKNELVAVKNAAHNSWEPRFFICKDGELFKCRKNLHEDEFDFWKVCEPAQNHFYFGKDREEDKL